MDLYFNLTVAIVNLSILGLGNDILKYIRKEINVRCPLIQNHNKTRNKCHGQPVSEQSSYVYDMSTRRANSVVAYKLR